MTLRGKGRLALAVTTAAVALAPGLAFAQAQVAQQGGLEEIVVTAQHRNESLQNIPITVEAYSGAALKQMGIENTAQLSDFTPGLNITKANIGAVPFLRGIGNFTASPGNEAAIATYVDGVYRPSAGSSTYSFNNIERIEVLNGPQGTLFGRNAAGGVINVITKDPTHTPSLSFATGYSSYNTTTEDFYASGGIANNLAADLAVYWQNQATGWGTNLYNGQPAYLSHELSLRSKWVWDPSDKDKVTFIGYYDRERNDVGSASNLLPGFTSQTGFKTFGGFYDISTNQVPKGESINRGGSIKIDHDFDWSTLTSISAFGLASTHGFITNDSCPCNLQGAAIGGRDRTWTEEVRLASPSTSKIQWEGGLYLFLDRAAQDPFAQYGTGLGNLPGFEKLTFSHQNTHSYAGFAQATVPVLDDKTDVTLGGRYTYDERSIAGQQLNILGAVLASATGDVHAGSPTFRAAVDHHFNDDILGYVSWNRGFKSGNYNLSTPTQPPTAPETLDAYEAGFKTEFFNHLLRLDTSAFYDKFHNLQVQQQLITGNFTTNAGAARYEGVDFAASAVPSDNLTLTLSGEVLSAKYTSYTNATLNFTAPTGLGFVSRVGDATGFDIPFADHFTATASALYKLPISVGSLSFFGAVAYHHGFPFDVQGITRQPPYAVVNSSVTWTSSDQHWDLKLWADNLLDKHYYGQKQVSAVGATYSAAAPRYVGATAKYHY